MDKKDRHFFKHDLGARNDEKIKKLRIKYKSSGYGAYMMLLEMLYESTDYMLEYDLESLAFDLRESKKFIKSIIEDFDLFVIEGGIFYSREVIRRMKRAEEKSEKARESISNRYKSDTKEAKTNIKNDTNEVQNEGNFDTNRTLNEGNFDTKEAKTNEKNDTKSKKNDTNCGQDKIREDKKREENNTLCERNEEDIGDESNTKPIQNHTEDCCLEVPNSVVLCENDIQTEYKPDSKSEEKVEVLDVETGEIIRVSKNKKDKKFQYHYDFSKRMTKLFDSWFLKMIADTPNKSNIYDVYDIWKHRLSEADRERCLELVDIYTGKYRTNRYSAVSYLEQRKFDDEVLHHIPNKASPVRAKSNMVERCFGSNEDNSAEEEELYKNGKMLT